MSQPASQSGAKVDLRSQMPGTAKYVDEKRQEWGKQHVNACIRKAMEGQPGYFFAMEQGHFLGTPFPGTHPVGDYQQHAVMIGSKFAAFMAMPGVNHG